MTEFLPEAFWHVLRSTVFLSVAAITAVSVLALLKPRSARVSAFAWSMVLLAGVLLVPATLEIPWYAPGSATSPTSIEQSPAHYVQQETAIQGRAVAPQLPSASAESTSASASQPLFPWNDIPAIAWLIGAAGILLFGSVSYVSLLASLRKCWVPQRSWQQEYESAAAELGVERPPELRVHPFLGPFLCLTPRGYRLIIPADQWCSLSAAERCVVLKHELAHFARGDVWRWIPMRLVVLLHWFNPLAWLAAARIEEAAERASDEIALRDNPSAVGDLASALLRLSRSQSRSRLLAPSMIGRSLKRRLLNLIHDSERKGADPMLKKMTLFTVLAAVLAAAAVQIRLVAQEDEGERPESRAQITVESAREFADRLSGEDDLTKQLREAVQSEAGALVLRDRAGHYEQEAREQLQSNIMSELLNEWFDRTDAGLVLKSEQAGFRSELLQSAESINADIDALKQALRGMAGEMDMDTDLDRLVHRFMTDDGAPIILYARELRQRMRPDTEVLERVFQQTFARRSDGKYEIRPDGRAQAEELAAAFGEREKLLQILKNDVAELAGEIADADDFHTEVKAALKDPLFITRLALELFENRQATRAHVNRMVEQLDRAFRDTADGLVIRDETKPEVQEQLQIRDRISEGADALRGSLHRFADQVSDHDDLHRRWKKMLKTDIALVRVASRIEYGSADVEGVVRQFMSQILVEKDNGKLHVDPPEVPREELAEHISEMFREYRSARRRGRELNELLESVQDEQLREALLSSGGKLTFADHLRRHMLSHVPDGFRQWIEDHFHETSDGLTIRDDAREAVENVLRDIAAVTKELENADF